jgi:hypothetical protein
LCLCLQPRRNAKLILFNRRTTNIRNAHSSRSQTSTRSFYLYLFFNFFFSHSSAIKHFKRDSALTSSCF